MKWQYFQYPVGIFYCPIGSACEDSKKTYDRLIPPELHIRAEMVQAGDRLERFDQAILNRP
jgi:hypothetical protein